MEEIHFPEFSYLQLIGRSEMIPYCSISIALLLMLKAGIHLYVTLRLPPE